MSSNSDKILNRLEDESKQDINWVLNLDCFILKIITIPLTEIAWVVASEEIVYLVNTKKGEIINKFENISELIFSAVIHPKTNDLLISTSSGVFILSTQGIILNLINEIGWFEHLTISKEGNIVFAAKGRTLYILEIKDNSYEVLSKDASFNSTISDIIFNDDSFLVSNYGSVRQYKTQNLEDYQAFEWKTSLLTISWSPDKKYIAAGTQENGIHFWPYPFEKETDFQINGYRSKVHKIIWENNATEFIVNCYEDVHIWDFSDGPPMGKSPITLKCGFGKITDINYKGNVLVAASEKGFIFYFLPANSEKLIQIHSVESEISCISMNKNENELYVGSKSGELYCFAITV